MPRLLRLFAALLVFCTLAAPGVAQNDTAASATHAEDHAGNKPTEVPVKASVAELLENERKAAAIEAAKQHSDHEPGKARTPLEAVLGLRHALREKDTERAAQYFDMRYLPEDFEQYTNEQLVNAFMFVFAQQNVLDITSISDDPEGSRDDGLAPYRDQVGSVTLSDQVIPVYLQRVPDGAGGRVWKLSNATIARIPDMWRELGYSDFAIWLGKLLPEFDVLGMANWQLVSLLTFFVVGWLVAGLITRVLAALVLLIPNQFPNGIRRFFAIPARVIVYLLLLQTTIQHLGLSVVARVYLQSSGIDFIAITIFITGTLTLWRDYKVRQLEAAGDIQYVALLRPLILIVKILVWITAALWWAKQAGFNVSAVIAGLGVGSLAVALAAQKTLENVIGAVTLYSARPVRAGDLCKFGPHLGLVEEIGLRSVTLRTLDRTVVTIPNAKFSAAEIENLSMRDRIRYYKFLQLQMPTVAQLRVILGELQRLFLSHPKVLQDTVSVRLSDIDAATAVVRIDCGVSTRDYQEYLAVAEDLNLRIIELVHDNGAIFSGTGQVLQLREFYQTDADKLAEVEGKLAAWREQGELPFPSVSATTREQLRGSLDYPPPGSPAP